MSEEMRHDTKEASMGRTRMMIRLLGVVIGWWLMGATFSIAAPPEGKGPDKDKENNGKAVGQQQTPPGQEKKAEADTARAERAAERTDTRGAQAESSNRDQAAAATVER